MIVFSKEVKAFLKNQLLVFSVIRNKNLPETDERKIKFNELYNSCESLVQEITDKLRENSTILFNKPMDITKQKVITELRNQKNMTNLFKEEMKNYMHDKAKLVLNTIIEKINDIIKNNLSPKKFEEALLLERELYQLLI